MMLPIKCNRSLDTYPAAPQEGKYLVHSGDFAPPPPRPITVLIDFPIEFHFLSRFLHSAARTTKTHHSRARRHVDDLFTMAKSARSSTKKANNRRLYAKVFSPAEAARNERLSAKLLELAKQPKPESSDANMDGELSRAVWRDGMKYIVLGTVC